MALEIYKKAIKYGTCDVQQIQKIDRLIEDAEQQIKEDQYKWCIQHIQLKDIEKCKDYLK